MAAPALTRVEDRPQWRNATRRLPAAADDAFGAGRTHRSWLAGWPASLRIVPSGRWRAGCSTPASSSPIRHHGRSGRAARRRSSCPCTGTDASSSAAWRPCPEACRRSSSTTARLTAPRSRRSPTGSGPGTCAMARICGAVGGSQHRPQPGRDPDRRVPRLRLHPARRASPATCSTTWRIPRWRWSRRGSSRPAAAGPGRRVRAVPLGARHGRGPSLVRPYSWVWYVPSAAMVARRDALGPGFDEQLSLARTSISSGACTTRDGRLATTRGSALRTRIGVEPSLVPAGSPTTSRWPARRAPSRARPGAVRDPGAGAWLGRRAQRPMACTGGAHRTPRCTAASDGRGAPARRALVGRSRRRAGDHPRGARAGRALAGRGRRSGCLPHTCGGATARSDDSARCSPRVSWPTGSRTARGSTRELRRPAARGRIRPRRRHVARVPARA